MSPVTSLAYNQAGRLATVSAAAQQVAQYAYDAFGQRLVKAESAISKTTLYQYGQNGLLLEESNNQGNPASADYIYLDDGRPVATLTPAAGKFYFMHDDRLGTPQLLTGSTQATVWSAGDFLLVTAGDFRANALSRPFDGFGGDFQTRQHLHRLTGRPERHLTAHHGFHASYAG